MATILLQNGAYTGAMAGIIAGRSETSSDDPADFATPAAIADAFATQFLTANAALVAPMADADNAQIGQLVQAVCAGLLSGRSATSSTAADYELLAAQAAAIAKAAVANLTA